MLHSFKLTYFEYTTSVYIKFTRSSKQQLCYCTSYLECSWNNCSSQWHNNPSSFQGFSAQHCDRTVADEHWDVLQLDALYHSNCIAWKVQKKQVLHTFLAACQSYQAVSGIWVWWGSVESDWWGFQVMGSVIWTVSISSPYYCILFNWYRLYYRNDPAQLSACPLTIHTLLHISEGIRTARPFWTYWAYPMECHCNTLLKSIRNRRHPYASINSFATATAQLNWIWLLYNLDEELCLDPDKKETDKFIHDLCTFNQHAFIFDCSNFKQIHFTCFLLPDNMKSYTHQYKIKFCLLSYVLQCQEECCSIRH